MIPHGAHVAARRTPQADTCGFFWHDQMKRDRVISFIDGFNLYHAIFNLNDPQFKWLDLTKLSSENSFRTI